MSESIVNIRWGRARGGDVRRLTVTHWLCLVALVAGVPACAASGARSKVAGGGEARDDEAEAGRIIDDVNAAEGACTVTQRQFDAMVGGCDSGVCDDCIRAGVGYWRGCGTAPDEVRAARYLGKACRQESFIACRLEAQAILESESPRPADAAGILARACEAGAVQACGDLGVVLTTPLANPSTGERERGIKLLFAACHGGYHVFCTRLATIVERQKLAQHFDETRAALKGACDAGYWDACYALAITHEDGTLGVRDYGVAVALPLELWS